MATAEQLPSNQPCGSFKGSVAGKNSIVSARLAGPLAAQQAAQHANRIKLRTTVGMAILKVEGEARPPLA